MDDSLAGGQPAIWHWIGAASSAVSALACLIVAAAAVSFLRHRADLGPVARRLGFLLVAFLVVVALTHLTQAFAPWPLAGRGEAAATLVRAVTAVVSLGAVLLVWPQLPRLLDLPSPRDLARSNAALAQANVSLETTIAWRTHELRQANERFETALCARTSPSSPKTGRCVLPGSTIRGRASPSRHPAPLRRHRRRRPGWRGR